MGEERRIFEYFVVVGLLESPEELNPGAKKFRYKDTVQKPPITDICIIFPGLGEQIPENFVCIESTPTGDAADLNHGSSLTPLCYLCYRRGYDKPPLLDIGVIYPGRGERITEDSQIVKTTPFGRPASVNNASQEIYLTYRRSSDFAHINSLAITDICVILTNKGETQPFTFYKINKNLNKGIIGSNVFICYKKSLANCNRVTYKPDILDRFPLEDYPDCPLPTNVPNFGLPMGALLECWPRKRKTLIPQFQTFVLTDQKGHKLFGVAVVFYELYKRLLTPWQLEKLGAHAYQQHLDSLAYDPEEMTFHTNKCIMVVSRYPFLPEFHRFLLFLIDMSSNGKYLLLIERYISHLLYEVPFPPVWVQIGGRIVCFNNPECLPLPLSGASFMDFIKLLNVENSVDRRYFDLYEDLSKDVTCVDLDTAAISQSDVLRQKIKINLLPGKAAKFLRQRLEALTPKVAQAELHMGIGGTFHGQIPIINAGTFQGQIPIIDLKRFPNLELEIQEAFLQFMVLILQGYQHYPIRSTPSIRANNVESLYDVNGFLRSCDKSDLNFYKHLTNTQLFFQFIEERSLLSDKNKNAYLAFFDYCIAEVDANGSAGNAKLLKYDCPSHTGPIVSLAPLKPQVSDELFTYQGAFPKLKLENFSLDSLELGKRHVIRVPERSRLHDAPSLASTKKEEVKGRIDAESNFMNATHWCNEIVAKRKLS